MVGEVYGVLLGAALLLLMRAHRQQQRLLRTIQDVELRAKEAMIAKAARMDRERFGKELAMVLQSADTLQVFGETLLAKLCRYLGAKTAVFHALESATGDYVLVASYAVGLTIAPAQRYQVGEGLAGQAALDRKSLTYSGIEFNGLSIESGTHQSTAMSIIIAPILSVQHVSGVIELGMMRPATDDDVTVIDEVLPVIALSLDILLAKRATAADAERYQFMEQSRRMILDHIAEGVISQDQQDRIFFVNHAALQSLGYTEEGMLGQSLHDLVLHHDATGRPLSRESSAVTQCLHDGATRFLSDQVFWRHDGARLLVHFTVTALMQRGQVTGTVISFRDCSGLPERD